MTHESLIPVLVVAISLVASITDVLTRRIPNVLTFGAALAGLVFHLLTGGFDGGLSAAGGWVVGTLLFLPFFALGGMGGGDVKLLAALGAWLGPHQTLWLAAYSAIAGGVLAVIVAASRGYLVTALHNVLSMITYWQRMGIRPVPNLTLEAPGTPRLAYAVPMFAGVVMTLWL